MKIVLTTTERSIELPVLPAKIEVQSGQNNETVTIHTVGEVNLLGKSGLKTIELSSFFPNQDYIFANNSGRLEPYTYIDILTEWKEKNVIIELTITDTNINFDTTIESLSYSEDDVTGDVNYTISLKEYRSLTRPDRSDKSVKSGSGSAGSGSKVKYKVKKGDTLKKIAKKYMGKTSYSKKLYTINKKAIESALKKYVKKENKKIKKYNKTHTPKKKLITWKTSKKGKHLIPGTVLVIPAKPKKSTKPKKSKKKKKAKKKKK